MKTKVLLVGLLVLAGLAINSGLSWAGFEEDYDQAANDWSDYQGDEVHMTMRMLQSTTNVLHRENMAILQRLDKIEKELAEVKDIVEE